MKIILHYILLIVLYTIAACGGGSKDVNNNTDDDMQSVEIKSVKTQKFEMQYARFGVGEKTMVLFPGLYTKSLMPLAENVAQYYARFAKDYTIYMLDRVENPPQGYSIANMADDAIEVLDSLRIKDAYFVGISMGGMIAQSVAIKRGDLVKKLFLGSTACKVEPQTAEVVRQWVSLAQSGDQQALNQAFAAIVYSESFYNQYRDVILGSLAGATEDDLRRFSILAAAIADFDVSARLASVHCPVLAVCASDDKIIAPDASKTIAEITSGECYIYDGYGHAVYDEAADYLERMERWMGE